MPIITVTHLQSWLISSKDRFEAKHQSGCWAGDASWSGPLGPSLVFIWEKLVTAFCLTTVNSCQIARGWVGAYQAAQHPHQVTFKQLAYYGCKLAFTKTGCWALAVSFQVQSLTMPPVPSAPLFTSCIVMTRHHLFTFFNYTAVGVSWTRLRRLFAWSPVHSVLHITPYLV